MREDFFRDEYKLVILIIGLGKNSYILPFIKFFIAAIEFKSSGTVSAETKITQRVCSYAFENPVKLSIMTDALIWHQQNLLAR